MCLKERFIAYRILRPAARRSCNEMFALDYLRPKQAPHALSSPTPEARQRAGVRASAGLDPRVGGREVLHGRRQAARRPRPPGEARPARVDPRQIERKCPCARSVKSSVARCWSCSTASRWRLARKPAKEIGL